MDANPSLYEFALAHARAAAGKRALKAVGKATELNESWLYKFAANKIPNAACTKVERLANHFRQFPALTSPAGDVSHSTSPASFGP
jgi:hypothetical protein